ncbi:hypothetical protein [Bacillus sp. FJAT-28004]|uniref:hypothetical protein n=1 Tax=Bacillus sp. FJAT-28004 TaxID=1679165 RepID=UPI0006B54C97|nr:hypothetical protein [Bacillus sp. FJAT-28004]
MQDDIINLKLQFYGGIIAIAILVLLLLTQQDAQFMEFIIESKPLMVVGILVILLFSITIVASYLKLKPTWKESKQIKFVLADLKRKNIEIMMMNINITNENKRHFIAKDVLGNTHEYKFNK